MGKKINFEKLPCYVDIRKQGKMELNVRFEFSNAMYTKGQGVAMGALAMKIYGTQGETEYSDEECRVILDFARFVNPMLADSLADIIEKKDGVDVP